MDDTTQLFHEDPEPTGLTLAATASKRPILWGTDSWMGFTTKNSLIYKIPHAIELCSIRTGLIFGNTSIYNNFEEYQKIFAPFCTKHGFVLIPDKYDIRTMLGLLPEEEQSHRAFWSYSNTMTIYLTIRHNYYHFEIIVSKKYLVTLSYEQMSSLFTDAIRMKENMENIFNTPQLIYVAKIKTRFVETDWFDDFFQDPDLLPAKYVQYSRHFRMKALLRIIAMTPNISAHYRRNPKLNYVRECFRQLTLNDFYNTYYEIPLSFPVLPEVGPTLIDTIRSADPSLMYDEHEQHKDIMKVLAIVFDQQKITDTCERYPELDESVPMTPEILVSLLPTYASVRLNQTSLYDLCDSCLIRLAYIAELLHDDTTIFKIIQYFIPFRFISSLTGSTANYEFKFTQEQWEHDKDD
jgi:hypothetical protein